MMVKSSKCTDNCKIIFKVTNLSFQKRFPFENINQQNKHFQLESHIHSNMMIIRVGGRVRERGSDHPDREELVVRGEIGGLIPPNSPPPTIFFLGKKGRVFVPF